MKASILRSPAGCSLLEIKPAALAGYWLTEVVQDGRTYEQSKNLNDGEAANLRARLIYTGWTELYRGEALK